MIRIAAIAVTLLLSQGAGLSQVIPPPVSVPTDPTEFGSLRLDPFESTAPPAGSWIVLVAGSYFNQWNGTWHTRRSHEDANLQGQPIREEELRTLEQNFPNDEIFRFDLEGTRFDLMLARGFGGGAAVQVRVPWILIGQPSFDSAAESFHNIFPAVEHYARDIFPQAQTLFYLRTAERRVLRRDELARSGIGDAAVSIGMPVFQSGRASHRLVLAVELPTGEENTLHGSGGYDAGLRWFTTLDRPDSHWIFGAGFTYLDSRGDILTFDRSNAVHLSADWMRQLSRRTSFHLGGRLDSSPLAGETETSLAHPTLFYRLGLIFQPSSAQWVTVDLGEELIPQIGVDADFSLHLGYGRRLP